MKNNITKPNFLSQLFLFFKRTGNIDTWKSFSGEIEYHHKDNKIWIGCWNYRGQTFIGLGKRKTGVRKCIAQNFLNTFYLEINNLLNTPMTPIGLGIL